MKTTRRSMCSAPRRSLKKDFEKFVPGLCDAPRSHDPLPAESRTMRSVSATRKAILKLVAQQNQHTAEVLAYMAELDRRRLYESLGYSTMLDYCVEHLHMDDEEAAERIEVARTALTFPILFEAIADGRLHLAAVRLLAPHLTAANVDELVAAMTHRPESEIIPMLAEWFPDPQPLERRCPARTP